MSRPEKIQPRSKHRPGQGSLYHTTRSGDRRKKRGHRGGKTRPGEGGGPQKPAAALTSAIRNIVILLVVVGALLVTATRFIQSSWQKKSREARNRSVVVQPEKSKVPPTETTRDIVDGSELLSDVSDTKAPLAAPSRRANYFLERGDDLFSQGLHTQAISKYKEALGIWPDLKDGWLKLGNASMRGGDYREARRAFEQALHRDPDRIDVLLNLGELYLLQNQADKSIKLFNTVINNYPNDPRGHYNLGLCFQVFKDPNRARNAFKDCLTVDPNYLRAHRQLALLSVKENNFSEATVQLLDALETKPESAELRLDLAAVSALQGHISDCLQYLATAEVLSSPIVVAQTLNQPAFRNVLESEEGQAFQQSLAARIANPVPATEDVLEDERLQDEALNTPLALELEETITEP
jgi:tetratricopeptide (TPR) repeat protein